MGLFSGLTADSVSRYVQQVFNYSDSDFMRDAGMTIGSDMASVPGQVLNPPAIRYAGSQPMVSARFLSARLVLIVTR